MKGDEMISEISFTESALRVAVAEEERYRH
jgi:hypothetical protein